LPPDQLIDSLEPEKSDDSATATSNQAGEEVMRD